MLFEKTLINFVDSYTETPTSNVIFKFIQNNHTVFIYIPFRTTNSSTTSADVVDLTSSLAPSNTLKDFNG